MLNNMNGARNSLYTSEYIAGNTVRRENTARQLQPKRKIQEDVRQRRRPVTEEELRRAKALNMSAPHVAFMVVVSIVCLVMCVAYLYVQADITATRSSISELKNDISTVQSYNNALNYSINSHVNVDHVYKVATKKLGMKQATDKQIFYYKASDNGYTLQYGDIPSK